MNELNNIFGGVEQLWEYIKLYAEKAGREAEKQEKEEREAAEKAKENMASTEVNDGRNE